MKYNFFINILKYHVIKKRTKRLEENLENGVQTKTNDPITIFRINNTTLKGRIEAGEKNSPS
jgi:hypothetical protein